MKAVIDCKPEQLAPDMGDFVDFNFMPGVGIDPATCRIQVWEQPQPEHVYAAGADFALGIAGRDLDTLCILDKTAQRETGRAVQVAMVKARLGERFERVLLPMLVWYNQAFLVGERQVGLPTLRRLVDVYGYTYVYYDRAQERRGRPRRDILGHHKEGDDVLLTSYRSAIREKRVLIRDREMVEQHQKLVWHDQARERDPSKTDADERLKIKLTGGGSPDMVMAGMYAWHACNSIEQFDKPKKKYPKGSLGDIFGFAETFGEHEGDPPNEPLHDEDGHDPRDEGVSYRR